jgi:hypothetical protein
MSPESPKSRFQKFEISKTHAETMASPLTQIALDTALLQMMAKLPLASDLGTASANYLKILGAKQFISEYMMLADKKDPPTTVKDVDNLQQN